jgi:hypothetical protein
MALGEEYLDAGQIAIERINQSSKTKLQRSSKSQTPSSHHQKSSKFQTRSAGRGLELGSWDLFGAWSLFFGVSIPAFPRPLTALGE